MSNRKPTKANRSPRPTPNVGFSGDRVTSAAAMMLNTVQPRPPVAPPAKRVGALSSPAPTAAAFTATPACSTPRLPLPGVPVAVAA